VAGQWQCGEAAAEWRSGGGLWSCACVLRCRQSGASWAAASTTVRVWVCHRRNGIKEENLSSVCVATTLESEKRKPKVCVALPNHHIIFFLQASGPARPAPSLARTGCGLCGVD